MYYCIIVTLYVIILLQIVLCLKVKMNNDSAILKTRLSENTILVQFKHCWIRWIIAYAL